MLPRPTLRMTLSSIWSAMVSNLRHRSGLMKGSMPSMMKTSAMATNKTCQKSNLSSPASPRPLNTVGDDAVRQPSQLYAAGADFLERQTIPDGTPCFRAHKKTAGPALVIKTPDPTVEEYYHKLCG